MKKKDGSGYAKLVETHQRLVDCEKVLKLVKNEELPLSEGTVYSVTGGDWDQLSAEIGSLKEEKIVVNMGPQHPSTHGVLRLVLELEGETVSEVRCGIGYLHTGIEKNSEYRTWTQATTFVTRMDYLSPLFNETAYYLSQDKSIFIY